jgi:hypothetical protein
MSLNIIHWLDNADIMVFAMVFIMDHVKQLLKKIDVFQSFGLSMT